MVFLWMPKLKIDVEMSKLWARLAGIFSSRTFVGADKAGNRYFTRTEEIDGIMKEKRWVIFKGEQDPTSVPVEWICWLNGQRKEALTPEEMMELELRRERVRLNVELLKKEEEERRAKQGVTLKVLSSGKVGGPDLRSFIRQFPTDSKGDRKESAERTDETEAMQEKTEQESSEPTGTGASFRPGTWQPPS